LQRESYGPTLFLKRFQLIAERLTTHVMSVMLIPRSTY